MVQSIGSGEEPFFQARAAYWSEAEITAAKRRPDGYRRCRQARAAYWSEAEIAAALIWAQKNLPHFVDKLNSQTLNEYWQKSRIELVYG